MADVFKEQLVKSGVDPKKMFFKIFIGIIISVVILIVVKNLLLVVGIITALFFVDYKYLGMFADGFVDRYIEFEYIATNGSFEVDKIINKARRKKQMTLEMKDITCFSKADGQRLIGMAHGCEKVNDFSNRYNKNLSDKYSFIIMENGKKVQVIFEPNEAILSVFQTFVPRHALEN